MLIHVARCDDGYALIDGRRVAFDQITHVGGRLQAFVDIPKARPAQRFEAIVVVRSDRRAVRRGRLRRARRLRGRRP